MDGMQVLARLWWGLSFVKRKATMVVARLWWGLARLWWLAFQAAAMIILAIHSLLSRLSSSSAAAAAAAPSHGRSPQVVGVVLDSHEAQHQKHDVLQLLQWLARAGVRHVSLYDVEGVLKSDIETLHNSLEKKLGEKWRIHCFYHKQVLPWNKEENFVVNRTGFESKKILSSINESSNGQEEPNNDLQGLITVEVLSHSDGKEAIVMAAKLLCLRALQSKSCSKLTEEDINDSLKAIGCAGPDPHLLLICSNTKSFLGFPPWRLRLTEILHMGSLKNLTQQSFLMALHTYMKKEQRYGK